MDELETAIAMTLRTVRLYWGRGRDPLTFEDKRRLAQMILEGLHRSRYRIEQLPEPPIGQGTGRYMLRSTRPDDQEP